MIARRKKKRRWRRRRQRRLKIFQRRNYIFFSRTNVHRVRTSWSFFFFRNVKLGCLRAITTVNKHGIPHTHTHTQNELIRYQYVYIVHVLLLIFVLYQEIVALQIATIYFIGVSVRRGSVCYVLWFLFLHVCFILLFLFVSSHIEYCILVTYAACNWCCCYYFYSSSSSFP